MKANLPSVYGFGYSGDMVTLYYLEELPNCSPKWLSNFTIRPVKYEGFNFTTSSPTLVILCLCDYSKPTRYEIATYGSNFHFPNINDDEAIFSCAYMHKGILG